MNHYSATLGKELTPVDQHMAIGGRNTIAMDPDDPGALAKTYFLRSEILLKDSISESGFKTIPKTVVSMPLWRAKEMEYNREGMIISEEEAAPYLEAQLKDIQERYKDAEVFRDTKVADAEKQGAEINELKDIVAKQSEQMAMLIELMKGKS